jgi:hypothetical protein
MDKMLMPANLIPAWRVQNAFRKGFQNNFLISTWGGLGDQVCAEPTLRYALKRFKDCDISLFSECPSLFDHLNFKEVLEYSERLEARKQFSEKYLIFDTIVPTDNLAWQFFSHCLTNAVDFASMCAFRCQLPIADREIQLPNFTDIDLDRYPIEWKNAVIIHPGRHWPSKTFPKEWWDRVIASIQARGFQPVIIGKETDDNRGTVDVHIGPGVIDTRNQLSLKELVMICKRAKYVLTNDSSPLHIAAAGKAHIFFVASCKHPDYITHWRNGQWGWRMKNLGLDGVWNYINENPSVKDEVTVEHLPDGVMEKILPSPSSVADEIAKVG